MVSRGTKEVWGDILSPIRPAIERVKIMDEEEMKGKVEQGTGTVKEKVGQTFGDPELVAEGKNDQDEGRVREGFGAVRGKVREGADALRGKAAEWGDRVRDASRRAGRHDDQNPSQADRTDQTT